jgi:hypothetical protein
MIPKNDTFRKKLNSPLKGTASLVVPGFFSRDPALPRSQGQAILPAQQRRAQKGPFENITKIIKRRVCICIFKSIYMYALYWTALKH